MISKVKDLYKLFVSNLVALLSVKFIKNCIILQYQKQALKKKVIFKRAEKYVKEYRAKERNEIRLVRMAKKAGNFYVPAEPQMAFVIRIRG